MVNRPFSRKENTPSTASVQDVPNGIRARRKAFSGLEPLLLVEAPKVTDAVQFYKIAFGAEEVPCCIRNKHNCVQLEIAGSTFIVAGLADDSASTLVSGFVLSLETEDVEAAVGKAVSAGASAEDNFTEFDGVPAGKVKDPYGFTWVICRPVRRSPSTSGRFCCLRF